MKLILLLLSFTLKAEEAPTQPIAKPFVTVTITKTESDGTVSKVFEVVTYEWNAMTSETLAANSVSGAPPYVGTAGYKMTMQIPSAQLELGTTNKPQGEEIVKGLAK